MSLDFVSLNVNGIKDKDKRNGIFKWLKEQNADVYMLQETHAVSDEEINQWSIEWNGQIYASNGTNFSRGVAMLVKPNLKLDMKLLEKDTDGRLLLAEKTCDDKKLLLTNVYSPNNRNQREMFVKKVKEKVTKGPYAVMG